MARGFGRCFRCGARDKPVSHIDTHDRTLAHAGQVIDGVLAGAHGASFLVGVLWKGLSMDNDAMVKIVYQTVKSRIVSFATSHACHTPVTRAADRAGP